MNLESSQPIGDCKPIKFAVYNETPWEIEHSSVTARAWDGSTYLQLSLKPIGTRFQRFCLWIGWKIYMSGIPDKKKRELGWR